MNIRKLLDWRKLLIYSHRWLGIGITVMFLVWDKSVSLKCVSSVYGDQRPLGSSRRVFPCFAIFADC